MKTANFRKGGCLFSLFKLTALCVILLFVLLYWGSSWLGTWLFGEYTKSMGLNGGMGAITINPFNQSVDVRDFWLENPKNYSKGNAIAFSNAYIDLGVNPMDLIGKKLVRIDEIRIIGLDLAAEISMEGILSSPKSNLTDILNCFTEKSELEKQDQKTEEVKSESGEPMRFIVGKIVFADGKMRGGMNGKVVEMPLPSFHFENVGGEKGYTSTELSAYILGAIIPKATAELVKELGKEGTKEGIKEGIKSLKNLFN